MAERAEWIVFAPLGAWMLMMLVRAALCFVPERRRTEEADRG